MDIDDDDDDDESKHIKVYKYMQLRAVPNAIRFFFVIFNYSWKQNSAGGGGCVHLKPKIDMVNI